MRLNGSAANRLDCLNHQLPNDTIKLMRTRLTKGLNIKKINSKSNTGLDCFENNNNNSKNKIRLIIEHGLF